MNTIAFATDLWVVDLREGARIVACRAPWERNTVGQSFAERLPEEEIKRLSNLLVSYEMKPILSETKEGQVLIVLPSLVPSATSTVVLLPQIERKTLLRYLAKQSGIVFEWSESLAEEASGRLTGGVKTQKEALESIVEEIRILDVATLAPARQRKEGRIDGFLKTRAEKLAILAGCSLKIGEWKTVIDKENFDFGLFAHFLLVSFLFCRTNAYDRTAELSVEEGGSLGEKITVSFACDEIPAGTTWEIGVLEGLAEERQTYFGTEYRDGRLKIGLVPRRIDFSYLGLKAPLQFL